MKKYLIVLLLAMAYACKTPYQPPVVNAPNSYLVVEGVINNNNGSTDSTTIKLSRTSNISASDKPNPELKAQVYIEDGQSYSYALHDAGNGSYTAGSLNIDKTKQYRLRIKTNDNKTYQSDLCSSVYTPPVDSIGFSYYQGAQLLIYANTHNNNNNTRYYRWDFEETWKIIPIDNSLFMTNGIRIVPRVVPLPTACWRSDLSSKVILASSIKLTNDVIYQAPITYISFHSDKIGVRYSILLKQYGLTQDAFTFWSQVQKNTEQLGSIFDPQPSQINGNIHCTSNPAEPVFGYISITNIQTKRIYINRNQIQSPIQPDYLVGCLLQVEDIYYINPKTANSGTGTVPSELIPITSVYWPISKISNTFIDSTVAPPKKYIDTGYHSAPQTCLDCSTQGSPKPPAFWKDF